MIIKSSWKDKFNGQLNIEKLNSIFNQKDGFIVSETNYPAGSVITEILVKCKLIVLSGKSKLRYSSNDLTIERFDSLEIPSGKYELTVDDSADLTLVFVWNKNDIEKTNLTGKA